MRPSRTRSPRAHAPQTKNPPKMTAPTMDSMILRRHRCGQHLVPLNWQASAQARTHTSSRVGGYWGQAVLQVPERAPCRPKLAIVRELSKCWKATSHNCKVYVSAAPYHRPSFRRSCRRQPYSALPPAPSGPTIPASARARARPVLSPSMPPKQLRRHKELQMSALSSITTCCSTLGPIRPRPRTRGSRAPGRAPGRSVLSPCRPICVVLASVCQLP